MQDKTRIDYIKDVYGIENSNNNTTVDYKDETIVSWSIEGVVTVEELENKYTDYEIEDYYKCVCNEDF